MAKYSMEKKRRIKEFGEVFTPPWLVKDMVDLVPDIGKVETTVLEPSFGTGNFLVEILKRKLDNCKSDEDVLISVRSLYGVELQADNVSVCHRRLMDLVPEHLREDVGKILSERLVQGDFLHPETIWFLRDSFCGPLLCL